MTSFLLLTALIVSDGSIAEDRNITYKIDGYIEINTFNIDSDMKPNKQVLCKQWVPSKHTHVTTRWFLEAKIISIQKIDLYYHIKILHGRMLYTLICKSYIETWTNYDPEILDRDILPVSDREKIFVNKKLKLHKGITREYYNVDEFIGRR